MSPIFQTRYATVRIVHVSSSSAIEDTYRPPISLGLRVFPSLPLSQLATLSSLCLILDGILPFIISESSELVIYPKNSIL